MVRVGIIGGGTAGLEAAREAGSMGAEVTIIERREKPDPPWQTWPDLVRPAVGPTPAARRPPPTTGSFPTICAAATSVSSRVVYTDEGAELEFDSVVSCTGNAFLPPTFQGSRKPGAHILDSPDGYSRLAESCASSENVVVTGEGLRGLAVAERLSSPGRSVRLSATRWRLGGPSPTILAAIKRSAQEWGVTVQNGSVSRALGTNHVEAAVIDGEVIRCDTLVFIPHRAPSVVPMGACLGPGGGLLVDGRLATTSEGVFAAGGCAEIRRSPGTSLTLDEDAGVSGRIAGANSVGGSILARMAPFHQAKAFGQRITVAGPGPGAPWLAGARLGCVSRSWSDMSACTIIFERATGRVLGFQLVEPDWEYPAVPLAAPGPSIRSLAYGELGSSDISLLSDTARQALREWQGS